MKEARGISRASQRMNRRGTRIGVSLPMVMAFSREIVDGLRVVLLGAGYRVGEVSNFARGGAMDSDLVGVIGMVTDAAMAQRWRGAGVSVVNVSGRMADMGLPTVTVDNVAVGRMGARHLLERGHRRLVFVSSGVALAFGVQRRDGFCEEAADAGVRVDCCEVEEIDDLLGKGTLPVGVMAEADGPASRVVQRVVESGLQVPEDVAIVGVDNDVMRCESAAVPLSSVDPSARRIGIEAAALLCRLIDGQEPPDGPILTPPTDVVVRESTDTMAVEDEVVRAALAFIGAHAFDTITSDDILRHVPVSRRTLEMRFATALGRSPHEEVHRVRLERAKALLISTDLTVVEVAERCGYTNMGRFYQRFQNREGVTPAVYRDRAR